MEFDTITLELEDGSAQDFIICDEFEMDEVTYLLLAPYASDENLEDIEDILFVKTGTDETCEEGEIIIDLLSNEEHDRVSAFYDTLLDNVEEGN